MKYAEFGFGMKNYCMLLGATIFQSDKKGEGKLFNKPFCSVDRWNFLSW